METVHERLDRPNRSVDNTEIRLNKLEALSFKTAGLEESQRYISKDFEDQKRKMAEITKKNKQLENENAQLNNRITNLEKLVSTEQEKRIQLEQYERREMVEIRGIPMEQGEDCIRITEQICALVGMTNNDIVEIAHRIKNGDITVKFRDRSSRDLLYKNKEKLKEKTAKYLDFQEENLIFINELLAFDTRKLLYDVQQKCGEIGIKKLSLIMVSSK